MSSRWEEAQAAFLGAWSAITDPCPDASSAGGRSGAPDWVQAFSRESGGAGAPAFAEAYRRFAEWVGAGLARAGHDDPAAALSALARALGQHIEATLGPAEEPAAAGAEGAAAPWSRLADALGLPRWPPETAFAPAWADLPGFPKWLRVWSDALQAWQRQRAALAALQRRQYASFKEALDRFAARLADETDSGTPITSLKGLFALWVECAETAHEAALADDGYGRDFGAFINAGAALRRAWHEAVAEFLATFDGTGRSHLASARQAYAPSVAPAATEPGTAGAVQDLERRLQDTVGEMETLREALAAAQAATRPRPAAPPKPKPPAATRAPAKKRERLNATPESRAAASRAGKASAPKPRRVRAEGEEFDIAAIGAQRS